MKSKGPVGHPLPTPQLGLHGARTHLLGDEGPSWASSEHTLLTPPVTGSPSGDPRTQQTQAVGTPVHTAGVGPYSQRDHTLSRTSNYNTRGLDLGLCAQEEFTLNYAHSRASHQVGLWTEAMQTVGPLSSESRTKGSLIRTRMCADIHAWTTRTGGPGPVAPPPTTSWRPGWWW